MTFLLNFLIFIIAVLVIFFLPGRLVLRLVRLRFSRLETATVSLVIGLLVFTALNYLLGYLGLRFLIAWVILGLNLAALLVFKPKRRKFFNDIKLKFNQQIYVLIFLILLGIIGQGSIVFFSGIKEEGGLVFRGEIHDAFLHLALIGELKNHFPPQHPGLAGELLTNYHYFSDLTVASFSNLVKLPILDLYFRFFPIFLSLLLGLSTFIAVRYFSKSEKVANIAVFLTFFCGDFSYLIPIFRGLEAPWRESSFWMSQTFSALYNPPLAFSLPIFLTGFFLFLKYLEDKKPVLLPITALTWGMMVGFKAYGAVVIQGSLLAASLAELILKRKFKIFLLFVTSLVIAMIVFLPNNAHATGIFLFAPGWFLRAMVENPDRLNIPDWVLREETYLMLGDFFGILRLRLIEFLIFLVGNLGIRMIGLYGLFLLLRKRLKMQTEEIFLFVAALISFLFPLLFIQKGSVVNTIQFSYYLLIIMNIFTAQVVNSLIKKKSTWQKLTILLFVLILAVPANWKMFIEAIRPASALMTITNQELEAIDFLKAESGSKDVILLYPSGQNLNSIYVSALSAHRIFYFDRWMTEDTLKKFKERNNLALKFFSTKDYSWAKRFLKENNISYVYLLKNNEPNFDGLAQSLPLVFENEVISIYQAP